MARILIGSATTGPNGVATFSNLAAGHYIFVEKTPPSGYAGNTADQPVTIGASPYDATAVDTPTTMGTLIVFKYDGSDEVNKPPVTTGATYELKLGTKVMKSSDVTGVDGKITYNNLFTIAGTPQAYTITETVAAPGYHIDPQPHTDTVSNLAPKQIDVSDAPEGSSGLNVTLEDSHYSEYTLPGAEYDLYYVGP